jgi:hypothetical protein
MRREPLVRMSLRPGSAAMARPANGSGASEERSMSWTNARKFLGGDAVLLDKAAQRRPVAAVIMFPRDQRARALVGEQFEQHRMRRLAVDDDDALDALLPVNRCRSRPWGSCRR